MGGFKAGVCDSNPICGSCEKEKTGKKSYAGLTGVYMMLIVYLVVIAYPLLWMVMSSFKTNDEIFFTHSWAHAVPGCIADGLGSIVGWIDNLSCTNCCCFLIPAKKYFVRGIANGSVKG
ncbi:hypothetical protein GCM10020331_084500 [Ectobacillus funiculus]